VMYIQEPPKHDLREVANYLRENYHGQNIVMIDCFWAYKYYPLGEFMNEVSEGWSNRESIEVLQENIRQVGLCILGKTEDAVNIEIQKMFNESVVWGNNSYYMVIDYGKHPV